MDSGTAGGFGLIVIIPLFITLGITILIGIGCTIRLLHHWQLVILSLLSLLFLVEMATEFGSVEFYNLAPIFYGFITIVFSLAWFFVLRKRMKKEV